MAKEYAQLRAYPPTRCGLATFYDSLEQVARRYRDLAAAITRSHGGAVA